MTIAAAGFGIIAAGMNLVGNAAITMANCFQTAVRFIMTAMTELGKLPQMMAKAGADAISGFVSGISKNQNPILKAGMGVATLFLKGISDVGGWHSPWVKTLLAGADAVIGLVTGVESNMAEVYEAGGETADALVDAISSGIAQGAPEIQSALDGALSGLDLNFSFSGFDVNSLFGTVEKGYGGMPSDVARMMNKDKVLDFSSALDTMSGSLDKVGGSAGKTKDSLASLEDTIAGQIDIFSEWSNKEAISADQMLHNMQSQIDGVTNWANNMQALGARGIDQGLLQKLAELGPQGADKVAAFASMTDEQLQQANALWAQSLLLPKSAASQIYSSFSAAGKNMTAGLVAGIDTHAADQPIHETGENANNEFCDVEGIKSPSRVYQQYGEYLIMGLENGIKARQHIPVNLLIMLANNMLNNFKSSIKVSDFYSIGANVTEGLAKGMESNLDKVRTAASKLSEAAKTTTAEDLKVESPSRVFMAIGRYVAEGLAIGIENNTGMVKDAVTSMSDQTIQGFKKATDLINEYVDENLNLCPVIKPTIDVGSLSAQVDRFNKTLDASSVSTAFNASKQSTQQTQNVSELQNGTGTTTGNTTFIQNNYSPKALSRAEIYRQTRNQFAMYKQSMG